MNAIGYIRTSKEDKTRPGISLENQEGKIELYCKLKDYNLLEIISDSGISAKNLRRPGIQQVLGLAKRKAFDALVVYAMSRLSRDVVDANQVTRLLLKKGISFHSITETIDTSTAVGRFVFNSIVNADVFERERTAERTADVLRHRRSNGFKTGGEIPYGFDLEGDKLVENTVEQDVIRYIRLMKKNGYSLREMCRNLEGNPTKTGKQWHPSTIRGILRREGK